MSQPMRIASTAPIPALRDLLALASVGGAADGVDLACPWIGAGDEPLWFSRAAWGLAAIVAAHRSPERAPVLWLPDYFCNQSSGPARAAGAIVVFYPVDESLGPDWKRCHSLAGSAPPDLFLQVHYFGRPADLRPARSFCDRHGAALIEDAAHVLAPAATAIGSMGDYVLWSLYKHLPIPDGGLAVIRPTARVRAEAIAAAAKAFGTAAPRARGWLGRRLVQRTLPAVAARLARAQRPFDDDPPPAPLPATPALSRAARRMIAACRPALATIAARHVAAERALRDALVGAENVVALLPPADGAWTPYRAVFRAADAATARRWYGRFLAAGQFVETWPDLAPEIRADEPRHRVALALRNTVLALPVNANAAPEAIAAAYRSAL